MDVKQLLDSIGNSDLCHPLDRASMPTQKERRPDEGPGLVLLHLQEIIQWAVSARGEVMRPRKSHGTSTSIRYRPRSRPRTALCCPRGCWCRQQSSRRGCRARAGRVRWAVAKGGGVHMGTYLGHGLVVDVDELSGVGVDLEGAVEAQSGVDGVCACCTGQQTISACRPTGGTYPTAPCPRPGRPPA